MKTLSRIECPAGYVVLLDADGVFRVEASDHTGRTLCYAVHSRDRQGYYESEQTFERLRAALAFQPCQAVAP